MWEFYASVQVPWGSPSGLCDKSLRWYHRTCGAHVVLKDLPPPSFFPDHARVLEASYVHCGSLAYKFRIQHHPCQFMLLPCIPGWLFVHQGICHYPPGIPDGGISREEEPRTQVARLVLSSLTVKEATEIKPKSVLLLLNPSVHRFWCLRLLPPLLSLRSTHPRAQGSVWP